MKELYRKTKRISKGIRFEKDKSCELRYQDKHGQNEQEATRKRRGKTRTKWSLNSRKTALRWGSRWNGGKSGE